MLKEIIVKGARENNLKNIDVTIPRGKLVVLTGVSGSGKSTLAFDTIFAEGQRRYIESLSSYARMFLGQMHKPDVDLIEGLSPSISIDQKTTSHNPRSTVGTVTEIYDYLRLLYAHLGTPYCPNCNKPITTQTIDNIVEQVLNLGEGTKVIVTAPVVRGKKGTFQKELADYLKEGYLRAKIDGNDCTLDEPINLDKNVKHDIYLVIDRMILKPDVTTRLTESLENALKLTNGVVVVEANGEETLYSINHSCPICGYSIEEIAPRTFSFNTPFGACPKCSGLGFMQVIDRSKIIKDENLSLIQGAISATGWAYDLGMGNMFFKAVARKFGVEIDTPLKDLPEEMVDMILYGTKGEKLDVTYKFKGEWVESKMKFEGIVPNLERRYRETNSEYSKKEIAKYFSEFECDVCHGYRLKPEALNVKIKKLNIIELTNLSVSKIKEFMESLKLNKTQQQIAQPILKEINARLDFLINVGLNYLTLSRSAGTLSGGEAQRIRLATQIGSGLTGVLYILDEPSIGLHQRDNDRLLSTLKHLRDLENTVIVVEHDEDTIRAADHIIDVGPYAGVHGGEIVASGSVDDLIKSERSITGKYLSGELKIETPSIRRPVEKGFIKIKGAKQNNLKNIDVDIPIGVITAITGVSGSGKSSLINEILYPAASNMLNRSRLPEGKYKLIENLDRLDKVINIDQSPIGRTPRSNPATYTNVFNDIRELFAKTVDAKERGYSAGRFSFNISGGRCENCGGDGIKKIEMFFLPDVYVTCDVCNGKRYNKETLEVKYKGKNIADVLNMTISEAVEFFENVPKIRNKLQTLVDVGLGYIKLGQPSTELSGGEAQRVKLATELSKRSTGKSLYILDEPTTGLSMYDVDKLIKILNKLVANGNTIVVIEHNLDVIKIADYIVDLGPEGGDEGGQVVASGTPEEICKNNKSITGKYLKPYLKK
ncbi:MAG: excinuclease ABC subunit UvrA [Clostridia bacterium]|nr:excinuclease ABC subunit UvrA [Clostridia bacterium]